MKSKFHLGIDARFITPNATGIGRYTYELIRNILHQDRVNTYTIFLNQENKKTWNITAKNLRIVWTDIAHYSWREQVFFPKILRQELCDFYFFPHFNVPIFFREKFFVTIHDLTLHFFPGKKDRWYRRWMYKKIFSHAVLSAKQIFTVSKNTAKDLWEFFPQSKKKTNIIYNGVTSFAKKSSSSDIPKKFAKIFKQQKPKYFLYTGVSHPHKNLSRLIEAFALFRQQDTSHKNIKLILTGPSAKDKNLIRNIRKHSLADSVFHLGRVSEDELRYLYQNAISYIFPSLYEGFGLPALEAMSANTPVVASHASSLPEICDDAALYCNPVDASDIAEKMYIITHQKKIRENLLRKGLKQWKRFNWKDMTEKMMNVWKKEW